MNTWFECLLPGEDSENLAAIGEAALDEIARVEKLLSRFDPGSEVARLNRYAAEKPVLVSYELLQVIQLCAHYWKETEGHFDLTASSRALVPKANFDFSFVHIEPEPRRVQFAAPGMFLDFGGFGKGYALDRALGILREFRVTRALLHGGTSSVLALGAGEEGGGWRVGIREPTDAAREVSQVLLRDEALSSSAVLGAGREVSDLIHGPSGRPLL